MSEAPAIRRSLGGVLMMGAGLLGAAGVALSAVSAHLAGESTLGVAGSFCLLHAAPVLSIGLVGLRSRSLAAAGVLLLAGAVLFATGVAFHAVTGVSLGPVAPVGGVSLVGGWLIVALAGVLELRRKTAAEQP